MGGCLGLFAQGKVLALQYDSLLFRRKNRHQPPVALAARSSLLSLQDHFPRIHHARVLVREL